MGLLCAQEVVNKNDDWREKHLRQTKNLIKQGDFTPIDEAFRNRDLDLLWSYYRGATDILYHTFHKVTPEMAASATGELARRYANVLAREEYAKKYLLQIPEHARHVGDWIEWSASQKGLDQQRGLRISALAQMGSEECIVELGRFIFDDRDPDYTPPLDSEPGNPGGSPQTIKFVATPALSGALRGKHAIADEIKDKTYGMNPDWFKMIHHWWLHSLLPHKF